MSNHPIRSSFRFNPATGVCYRWLKFLGFPDYKVGDDGSVWSRIVYGSRNRRRGPWWKLKPVNANGGRPRVTLYRAVADSANFYVHQLVLLTFVGPCPEGMEGCHTLNPDPWDNRLENLRWDTHENNLADMDKHGTRPKGESCSYSVLTEKMVREIRHRVLVLGHKQKDVAADLQIQKPRVSDVICGRTWKHVT